MSVLGKQKTFLEVFPPPEFLLLTTSGIALSDKAARFVKFKRNSFRSRSKVSKWERVILPIGAIESGFINDPEQVTKALKQLSTKYNLRYVRASLPDEKAYLFTAVIDKVPPTALYDAVAFIIEENVPISLDKAVFDFRVTHTTNPAKIKVIVTVVHRKVIDAYSAVFEAAGMSVVAYDIESQALAKAVITDGNKRTVLIVSVGEKKISFYVVENEIVQFSTTPAQDMLAPGASLTARDLKSEMQKIFTFWNSRVGSEGGGERKIEGILLCGSGVSDDNLVMELSSEFPVEYIQANVWTNTRTPGSDSAILPQSSEYATAVGLAITRK